MLQLIRPGDHAKVMATLAAAGVEVTSDSVSSLPLRSDAQLEEELEQFASTPGLQQYVAAIEAALARHPTLARSLGLSAVA